MLPVQVQELSPPSDCSSRDARGTMSSAAHLFVRNLSYDKAKAFLTFLLIRVC